MPPKISRFLFKNGGLDLERSPDRVMFSAMRNVQLRGDGHICSVKIGLPKVLTTLPSAPQAIFEYFNAAGKKAFALFTPTGILTGTNPAALTLAYPYPPTTAEPDKVNWQIAAMDNMLYFFDGAKSTSLLKFDGTTFTQIPFNIPGMTHMSVFDESIVLAGGNNIYFSEVRNPANFIVSRTSLVDHQIISQNHVTSLSLTEEVTKLSPSENDKILTFYTKSGTWVISKLEYPNRFAIRRTSAKGLPDSRLFGKNSNTGDSFSFDGQDFMKNEKSIGFPVFRWYLCQGKATTGATWFDLISKEAHFPVKVGNDDMDLVYNDILGLWSVVDRVLQGPPVEYNGSLIGIGPNNTLIEVGAVDPNSPPDSTRPSFVETGDTDFGSYSFLKVVHRIVLNAVTPKPNPEPIMIQIGYRNQLTDLLRWTRPKAVFRHGRNYIEPGTPKGRWFRCRIFADQNLSHFEVSGFEAVYSILADNQF